ncbi:DUF5689 domain-containing protein [Flagellimonas sp.]|uniref:DUF5689 domain-containing protein n=1 Tax=Flagellimonas sp. TaxID=2058762 RepID=UPI003B5C9010
MKSINKTCYLLSSILFFSCVVGSDFDALEQDCDSNLQANISFEELDTLFKGETIQIHEDLIIEGYVISSDRAGNFFGVIHLQDHPTIPTKGLQLEVDLRDSHLFFETGSKVQVKLKGLYLGKSGETLKLGGSFSAFGNVSVGRLPALKIPEHIFLLCEDKEMVKPVLTTIPDLENLTTNILVKIDSLEVVDEALGMTFALPKEETEITLKDCEENEIVMLNSGFSDFQAEILPEGNGAITGILKKNGKKNQIVIRDLRDLDFINDRCPEIITEFTSRQIFISELADPDNNSSARFVELYNAASQPLDFNKWVLNRFTNDKTEISSSIDLSGFIIEAQSTLVISPNAEEFELVYGFPPDLGVSTNSPADSNGDDNLELVDPFGMVIDRFGVIGEDGSGTNHEFEDGRAVRNANINKGNPSYTFSEWTIFNDTGDSGTTKLPQNAPEDFTPKGHH